MAVFCHVSGVRLIAPTGDEAADCAAWDKTIALAPVSIDEDPRGWKPVPPLPRKPKTTAAPSVERAPQPLASAGQNAPHKGNK